MNLRSVINGLNSFKELLVHINLIREGGYKLCSLFSNGVEGAVSLSLRKVKENGGNSLQKLSGESCSLYSVLKIRCLWVVDNGLKFSFMLLDSLLNGRDVIRRFYLLKRGNTVRGVPLCKQGIL